MITRLIGKWLQAGGWEEGKVSYPPKGPPQVGVVSPIPSNIDGHEVLDKSLVKRIQPRCRGHTFMVRFADDFIMGFEHVEDARKVMRVIDKRFARFGLKVNAENTRLVPCKRPPLQKGDPPGRARDVRFPWAHALLGGEGASGQLWGEAADRA